ncbi:MAG TPA: hypothetical protein VFX43_02395, partial [Chitinophagaceae bacterium]|nr:hypothetical protein [Chitinophagaceae bacterium]
MKTPLNDMPKMKLRLSFLLLFLTVFCTAAFSQIVYVSPTGSTTPDGSIADPYTLSEGILNAAPGNIIRMATGTYDGLVVIDKPLTIEGVDSSNAKVTYSNTPGGGVTPALFKVAAKNVTIENISFHVDLTKTSSAIITSG